MVQDTPAAQDNELADIDALARVERAPRITAPRVKTRSTLLIVAATALLLALGVAAAWIAGFA